MVAKTTGRTLRLSKNKRVASARPPAPGERKEFRKRLVLNNPNALEVPGLQDLTIDKLSIEKIQSLQGTVVGFQPSTVDALRALEAFKPGQTWGLFQRPASLIRKETVEVARELQEISESETEKVIRKVLFGERGSGKSVLQLQAMAMAYLKGWIVVHIPEAKTLVDAHASYQPAQIGDNKLYIQPHLTAKLLDNLAKANQEVLSNLTLREQHSFPVPLQSNMSLARFVELGAQDVELAWPVWKALWRELLAPSRTDEDNDQQRPSVLFAVDGVDHLMRNSAYLDPEMQPIHAHDLALARDVVSFLSGETKLTNGGMIIGSVSESHRAGTPTFNQCLARNLALQSGQEPPRLNSYIAFDQRVRHAMQTADVKKILGLTKEEARGIMEYYALSGLLRTVVTDSLVSERWTLAGGGIIGQIENGSVRTYY